MRMPEQVIVQVAGLQVLTLALSVYDSPHEVKTNYWTGTRMTMSGHHDMPFKTYEGAQCHAQLGD